MADKTVKITYQVETTDIEAANAIFLKIAKNTDKADKEVTELGKDAKKAGDQTANSFKKASNEAQKLGKASKDSGSVLKQMAGIAASIGAAAGIGAVLDVVVDVGKQMVATTAEFQKFEAVLTNTLGSSSKAQIALIKIQEFAAQTPFSVAELTESFVKLANQGFIPTTNQLRQLGDLASSVGKPFDQLTEAILDAQTGEFERLKEFGIKAKQAGDKVTFTFKEQKVTVDNTAESIQAYILGLGDLKGVSGSMAAVSATLGGQISNLGDSWDQLMLSMGSKSSGVLNTVISLFSNLTIGLTKLSKGAEQLAKEQHLKNVGERVEEVAMQYNQLVKDGQEFLDLDETSAKIAAYKSLNKEFTEAIALRQKEMDLISKELDSIDDPTEKQLESQAKRFEASKNAYEVAVAQLEALDKLNNKEDKANEKKLGLLEGLRKKVKDLNEEREKAPTEKEIKGLTRQIKVYEAEIKRLLGIGEAAKRAKIELEKLSDVDYATGLTKYGEHVKKTLSDIYNKVFGEAVSGSEASSETIKNNSDKFIEGVGKEIGALHSKNVVETTIDELEKERVKARYERNVKLAQDYTAAVQNLYSQVVSYQNELDDQRLQRLEANKERELAIAGTSAVERNKIEIEFDRKQRAIRQKQAEREKRLAIFNAIINVAQGITAALSMGLPGIVLAVLVAAAGAVQIAAISSQQVPAYAKGTKGVKGRGNKDSEHALLTPGEMVIPVSTKKKYNPILDAIFDNRIDPKILNDIALGRSGGAQMIINDNKALLEEMKKIQVNKFSFDEDGFTRYQEKGASRTKYLEKKYRAK